MEMVRWDLQCFSMFYTEDKSAEDVDEEVPSY